MANETTAVVKQPSAKALAVTSFKKVMENNFYQQQLKSTLKENAGTFCTSLMELVTGDQKLLQCQPNALMAEAVKAASLHLALNKQLGYAYLVPFNNKIKNPDGTWTKQLTPTLVIGYKGLLQLALRSGQYRNINADVVYEGEYQGCDKLSGNIDLSGERTGDHIVGYFAYIELKNGFTKMLFMSAKEMAHYCKTYSPTMKFSNLTEDQLQVLADRQAANGVGQGVGWQADYNNMAVKTTLRRLLSKWGYLSIEMSQAMADDETTPMSASAERDAAQSAPKPVIDAEAVPVEDAKSEEPDLGKLDD
jgi:recombination protein RecT